ncbi:HugZ family heme oxygenase [Helicobacter labacensis]|uniref:HugZ family heme oxygenase n=1 Tax=Helicobacter labacensis TaxID=2316079 RepID=UPI000EAC25DF|nr:HugZ family heme oxygenase [Helicobacter labacensis]
MDLKFILDHMNANHVQDMKGLLAKFGQIKDAIDVRLKNATTECIEIAYRLKDKAEEQVQKIDYPAKVAKIEDIKNAIIELCKSVPQTTDLEKVRADLEAFRESVSSVCVASLNPHNEVVCSYSALLSCQEGDHTQFYIYVSEVAEHFSSLKAHPENVEIMFLEDEASAKSPILRKRLRYKTRVHFVERGAEFDRVYDNFLARHGKGRGLETIRHMQDFHLIKLEFVRGRFVKGFGQAYDIDAHGRITYVGAQGNPHTMDKTPHAHSAHPHASHPHAHAHS